MGDWLRSSLYFPDDTVGWVPFALLRALELHFAHPFDLVYTSSPPRSAPLIGYLLKRFLGLRWVAEFRDPWYLSPRPFRSRADAWLLRCLLRRADRVVVISEGHAEELERAHGLRPDHLAIISNGFDEGDFQPEPPPFHPAFAAGFIHLSHFGAVYPRFSGNFFRALAEVLQEQPEARRRLRVNIVGFPDETCLRYAQENALGDVVKIHDFMGHSESLQAMAASRCLLLFLANKQVSRLSGLGKIYWYLRVGRPILAVASEGGTKNLVEAGQAGWVVEPEDTEGLKGVLRQLLRQEWNGSPPRPLRPEFVSQFRYDRLVEKLARTLSEVAVRGR
ncbi:MAG: glycosyltransferase [Terriglobales bacterium]